MSQVPDFESLLELLNYRAKSESEEPAYIFLPDQDGLPESLSYSELLGRAKEIAAHLQHGRDPRAQTVLLMLQPGLDYVAAFFGCLYAGAIPVPAYPPSSGRQLARLQAIASDARAFAAITTSVELQRIDKLRGRGPDLAIADWLVLDALPPQPRQWSDPGAGTDTLAFLQYTSGSTSTPKGVMVSHGNLLNNLALIGGAIKVNASDVTVSWLPPYHDFGLIGGILHPLYWGHRCVLMRPTSFLLNPFRWLKAMSDYRGTISSAPNFAYDLCVRTVKPEQKATIDLSHWRIASNGAEPIRRETMSNFSLSFAECGFQAQAMVPGYGLAESTLLVTAVQDTPPGQLARHLSVSKALLQGHDVELSAEGPDAVALVSVGTVLAQYKFAMVDPDTLQPCAEDRVGELWLQGPCVAQGYWQRPQATQDAFHARIAGADDGPYLRTGDLGFFHEGELYICGRLKDLIIINGRNIYPQDVESASFGSHEQLRRDGAIAFGLAGEQAEQMVLVQEMDFRATASDTLFGVIASAIAEQVGLPPDVIVLVKAGQIPRTSSGKLQRQLCKKMFEEGLLSPLARWNRPRSLLETSTAPARAQASAHGHAARVVADARVIDVASMENLLRGKLAARLGLPVGEIDTAQAFATYGLDSLAAVQLAHELSDALGSTLAPTIFWDHPSIGQLAPVLAAQAIPEHKSEPASVDGAEPIAMIGMGCRFPGADDIDAFWSLLREGGVATGPIAPARVDAQTFIRPQPGADQVGTGGFLRQVDLFDAEFFGISPLEAAQIDPQQRLVMEVAWEALENAGIPAARIAGSQTGVFVGISTHDYESLQARALEGATLYAASGNAASIAANRLSYLLDLRGPSVAVDTACSSSLVAVHLACQSLRRGESVLAFAGGVNLILNPELGLAFAKAGMLAPDGLCKSFDAAADGYVRGEGCGVVVLKRLSEALRDGDPIHAVIRGSAIGQDGRSNGLIAPNGAAQAEVLRRAFADAGVAAASVAYVEAHGTGTALGDPIELRALKEVLLAGRTDQQRCYIGTVKTNIGHLEAAAGIAGLIKAALALEHEAIPANLHYHNPSPHCSLAGLPLEIPTRLHAWQGAGARYAGVSSFGFGGSLAHVVLEQAPKTLPAEQGWPWQLLTWSAKTATALDASAGLLADRLAASPGLALSDLAYTHQIGRNAYRWRSMLVCSGTEDARQVLNTREPDRLLSAQLGNTVPLVFLMFPGQGAQEPGMASELYEHLPAFRGAVDECALIVQRQSGIDMYALLGLADGSDRPSAEQLRQTQSAQLGLFVVEYALAQCWMGSGIEPAGLIGHSLGEYVAACVAGVFSLEDALAVVAARGRLMQQLAGGAMVSVSLGEAEADNYLDGGIALAAVNGHQRCVLSGAFDAVEALERRLSAQGVPHRRLSTSHAFHSHMMDAALEPFCQLLTGFTLHAPRLPFISNLTGTWITEAEASSPAYWVRHLRQPVRFAQGLATLAQRAGVAPAVCVEVGPGRTLATLAQQFANAGDAHWTMLPSLACSPQMSDLAQHLDTLGRLWLAGQDIDWTAVYAGQQRRRIPLPTYPFERRRHWVETAPAAQPAAAIVATPAPALAAGLAPALRSAAQVEHAICEIVAELLRIDPVRISPQAPLLELGADSLILIQAISRIQKHFGITVTIRQLFGELTTIAALAAYIGDQLAATADAQPALALAATGAVADAGPSDAAPALAGDNGATLPLERIIKLQIDSLERMTQQTTQVLLQQLDALKSYPGGAADGLPSAPTAPERVAGAPAATTGRMFAKPSQFDPYAALTAPQEAYLRQFIARFAARTRGSLKHTALHKPVHADYRAQAGFRFSSSDPVLPLSLRELFYPIVSERAAGSRIWDVDGNEYVDLTMGFGVHFFGHSPPFIQQAVQQQMQLGMQIGPQSPLAGEVAQLVHELTGMQRVAFCNSGTEAVILALRLARTATGRGKFVMFNGSYHGWSDGSLVGVDIEQGGDGSAAPLMPGLTPGVEQHALVLEYGEAESLDIIRRHAHELAAVLVEPVQGRHPELQPREFLRQLRALTSELGITLIFDEIITGFRLHPGGAQAVFGVSADIATYGKAAGGGLPLGMVAGAARYLDAVDGGHRDRQSGRASVTTTFFAGTFSKHPLTMAAARAVLRTMQQEGPALQERLTQRTTALVERINALFVREQLSMRLVQCGSLFRLNTTGNLDLFCYHLVMHGLYVWEGRNMFLSTAHSDADLEFIYRAFEESVHDLRSGGFLPPPDQSRSTPGKHSLSLTPTQHGIWLECKLDPEASLAYHTNVLLRLTGPLEQGLLRSALHGVIERHDALRTVIDPSGQLQHILPAVDVPLAVVSFADADGGDAAASIERWLDDDNHRPFDLERGPLLRAALLHEGGQRHLLSLSVHHLVSDGISNALLIEEIAAVYSALRGQAAPALVAALPLCQYVAQRQSYLDSEQRQRDESYWSSKFADLPPSLSLPTDRPVHRQSSLRSQREHLTIDSVQYRQLMQFCREHGCTLFMTLMAATSVLIQRLTGQDDIVIGMPVAVGRPDELESHLLGCTLNMVPVRCKPRPDAVFSAYLAELKSSLVEAYLHAEYPFTLLTRKLGQQSSLHRRRLAPVMFNLDRALNLPRFAGLDAALAEGPMSFGQDDLMIDITQLPDQLAVKFQYNTDLFDGATIARMTGYFKRLLEAIVADPTRALGRLPMLEQEERRRLLVEWNATATRYEGAQTIQALFEAQVARSGEQSALVFEGGALGYGELNARANRLAHRLRELGVGPDVLVAICAERSVEMVVGLLAVLKAGGAYLPLDPAYPAQRLAYMLEDAAPKVLLTQSHLLPALPAHAVPTLCLDAEEEWAGHAEHDPQGGAGPGHLAYVIYTSGSTGRPKGAGIAHAGIVNRLRWMQDAYGLRTGERVLQKTPFSFDVSVWEFFWPLITGATLVVARPGGHQDVDYLARLIEQEGVTTLHFVPPMLEVFLATAELGRCAALRRVICSGQALPLELQQRCFAQLPGVELHNLYGPTEASVDVSHWACRVDASLSSVPIGRPIANIALHVLDEELEPVPVGVAGELHIAGIGLARGYLGRGALTAEKFIPNPYGAPGSRMYKSGDLVRYLASGAIEYLGRIDEQVKIRGLRIELGEVEAALKAQAGVRDAVVLAREDVPGDQRLVAYLVADQALAIEALRANLAAQLPDYMVPSALVQLAQLPLSPNGKLDRKALPAPVVGPSETGYVAARTETEAMLARLWAGVLKIDAVGVHDNFFALGGHSLLAVELIERIRLQGVQLDARRLYAAPTVAALALALDGGCDEVAAEAEPNGIPEGCQALSPDMLPLVRLSARELAQIVEATPGGAPNVQDIYPLTPLQEGIWFHHLVSQDHDAYVMASVLAIDTRERLDAFIGALQAVIDRHDILRTAVLWEGLAAPVQVVCRYAPIAVEDIVLDGAQGELAEQMRRREASARYRLDIRCAPLMRALVVHDPAQRRWLLQILVHHLVCDHTTLDLLIGEVATILRGQAAQLPPALPFRTFVAHLRRDAREAEHQAFFSKMLADVSTPSAPFGFLDVQGDGSSVTEVRRALEAGLAARIRHQARRHSASAASLVHLGWAQVLARVSGQQDVVFGTVLLGRMGGAAGNGRALGLFTNTLPVRIAIGARSVAESLQATHCLLSELLEHEQAPLALAQRCSSVAPTVPLFSALMNYRYSDGGEASVALDGVCLLSEDERTNYPVVMSVDDLGAGFELVAQVVDAAQAKALCDYLHTALEQLVYALESAPGMALAQLDILPAAERTRLLVDCNATQQHYDGPRTIHALFEARCARSAGQVALVFEGDELSYSELNARANRLANRLRELGVGPDALVGICAERSVDLVVGLLAVLKAGGAYLPLDPAFPAQRLAYMLEDAAPTVLLTQSHLLQALPAQGGQARMRTLCLDCAQQWAEHPAHDLQPVARSQHLAYVIYTSGSTGKPKGVAVAHASVVNFLNSMAQAPGMGAADVLLSVTSLSFDIAVLELLLPLVRGARCVLTTREQAGDPLRLAAMIATHGVTAMQATPSTWRMLVDTGLPLPLSAVKVLCGGEALSQALVTDLLEHTPAIWNMYGPTETTIWSAAHCVTPQACAPLLGAPIANTRLYILDEDLAPAPAGVAGELYIAGAGLARGYLHRPGLTAERFLPDPFVAAGARMYRTGDLVRRHADASIEYLGRIDHQVKLRGFRVELGEIEAALAVLPGVSEAIVLAREDVSGDQRLVAYVLHKGDGVDAATLRTALAAVLPEYMVPAQYVLLERFPRTPNGKTDRKALPAPEQLRDEFGYVAPRDAIEESLAAICAEVFKLDQVGIHDNFFTLGGHSLLVTRMNSRISHEFGINLPVRAMFETSTVAGLAERVRTLLRLVHARTADLGAELEQIDF